MGHFLEFVPDDFAASRALESEPLHEGVTGRVVGHDSGRADAVLFEDGLLELFDPQRGLGAGDLVTVHGIDSWFAFDQISCTSTAGQTTTLTGLPVEVLSVVSNALSSLQSGDAVAPWKRVDDIAQLNVAEALTQEAGFPFLTVQERIVADRRRCRRLWSARFPR